MSKMSDNTEFVEKLRSVGLRPTKQRLKICKILFDRKNTFHFTISDLQKIIKTKIEEKVSLATIYNTLNQFTKKGLLRHIIVDSSCNYFDTNTSHHHHFFFEKNGQLKDIPADVIRVSGIPPLPKGAAIDRIDIIIRVC